MTKTEMMKTVNAVALLSGEGTVLDENNFNYTQVKEMFLQALDTLNEKVDEAVDSLEDADTEEVPRQKETKRKGVVNQPSLFGEFLNLIHFEHPISEETYKQVTYYEFEKEGRSMATFHINTDYYKANRTRMYKFVAAIIKYTNAAGAKTRMERRGGGGSFLVISW